MSHEQEIVIVRDRDGVRRLIEYLEDKDIVAIDTETTGVTASSEIIGYSVCAESCNSSGADKAYYVIVAEWDCATRSMRYLDTKELTPQLMNALLNKRLVLHNAVFDCMMIERNYGVSLIKSVFADTMILAHLIDENRKVGLKELAATMYGESARDEQREMAASVAANGGKLTKKCFELYKGDSALIAKYGAKDALLTLRLFYDLLPALESEGLTEFFFDDECMPLLRSAAYQMNFTGLKVDIARLHALKAELEVEAAELGALIDREITPFISDKYPATSKRLTFNIDSRDHLAWLLFEKLHETFVKVSDVGAKLCRSPLLNTRRPYSPTDKRRFVEAVKSHRGQVWRAKGEWDRIAKKFTSEAKVRDYWTYLSTDKATLQHFAPKYRWVDALLRLKKVEKLLSTYVQPMIEQNDYGVMRPQFLQHGTSSGRFSSRAPNFQTLPREDRRIKECIVARPGRVFVGADMSQLEPRVFASYSQDEALLKCFAEGQDFYSVIGARVYGITGCSLVKQDDDPTFFGNAHKKLRQDSKTFALAATYGTTASKMAPLLGKDSGETRDILEAYFAAFPGVRAMMLEAHEIVKQTGYVQNLFGRRRRIPDARLIPQKYGNLPHDELPYEARTLLNLAVNHRIQSTGASVMNRASIRLVQMIEDRHIDASIVLQVHDELVLECPIEDADSVAALLKTALETTVSLPGVALEAVPKIGHNLAALK